MEHVSLYNPNSDLDSTDSIRYPQIDVLIHYDHSLTSFEMFIRRYYVDEKDISDDVLFDYDGSSDQRFGNKYFEVKDLTNDDGSFKTLPIRHENHTFVLSDATFIPRIIARMDRYKTTREGDKYNTEYLGCNPHQYSLFKVQANKFLFSAREKRDFDSVLQVCGERITFISFNECTVSTLLQELEMLRIFC